MRASTAAISCLLSIAALAPLAAAWDQPCVDDLHATVSTDGTSVELSWTAVGHTSHYDVYGSMDNGTNWIFIATVDSPATNYTDSPAPPGHASYKIAVDGVLLDECGSVSVDIQEHTEVPFFPTTTGLVIAVAASAGIVGAVVIAHRRRA